MPTSIFKIASLLNHN
jgi:hypothetical protein